MQGYQELVLQWLDLLIFGDEVRDWFLGTQKILEWKLTRKQRERKNHHRFPTECRGYLSFRRTGTEEDLNPNTTGHTKATD